jgi:integrase
LDGAVAPHIRLFIALALYTAARTGAILELEWEQVHIEGEIIALGRGRRRKRRAVVPIVADLKLELLQAANATTIAKVIEHRGRAIASIKQGSYADAKRAKLPGISASISRPMRCLGKRPRKRPDRAHDLSMASWCCWSGLN